MICRGQLFLLLTFIFIVSSCCAFDRSNSKRLRWDQETDKQLDSDGSPYSRTYYDLNHKDREMMFINNMAYGLSKKEQAMMWDLYLRKGYGPSLSTLDHHHQEDLPSTSLNDPEGTDNRLGLNTHLSKGNPDGHYMEMDNNLRNYPDAIASRILDQYEITKASRIVPEYERDVTNELDSNGQKLQTTQEPTTTGHPLVEDKLVSETNTSKVSIWSYIWDTLKDNIGELLGREMRDTIINTLWSWWMSIVEFAKARGKRAIQGPSLHPMTSKSA